MSTRNKYNYRFSQKTVPPSGIIAGARVLPLRAPAQRPLAQSPLLRQPPRPTGQPWQLPPTHQKNFEYDPADNLIGRREGSQHQLLHYDATARIIASEDNVQGQRETFAYDAAANLLDGPQVRGGWVRHNKLLTYQDKRYRYDGFGRLIEKRSAARGLQHFAYDAEHRLIEVRSQKNGRETLVKMTYAHAARADGRLRSHKTHVSHPEPIAPPVQTPNPDRPAWLPWDCRCLHMAGGSGRCAARPGGFHLLPAAVGRRSSRRCRLATGTRVCR
ncbi:hypothetical protein PverR02_12885 [Pseudomonas veronii]|nr:hypothetical protein PverR02_12885 [Pseudomonas veronii]